MFDSLKNMSALMGLMKNREAIADAMSKVAQRLAERRVTVNDRENLVKITMTGSMRTVSVEIDPGLIALAAGDPVQKARLEKLLAGAMDAAVQRVKQVVHEESSAAAADLGLPELPALDQLLGGAR